MFINSSGVLQTEKNKCINYQEWNQYVVDNDRKDVFL